MNNILKTTFLLALMTAASLHAQELSKLKVKAFVDLAGNEYTLRLPNSAALADDGSVVCFYPAIATQPDFVEEKGPEKAAALTWSRDKIAQLVTKDMYLVYGRDKVTPMTTVRFNERTYVLSLQTRAAGGSAIIYNTLDGRGITPSSCNELWSDQVTTKFVVRPGIEVEPGMPIGLHAQVSQSGKTMLVTMVGPIQQGAKNAPVAFVIVDQEMQVKYSQVLFMDDSRRGSWLHDVQLSSDSTFFALVQTNVEEARMTTLYKLGSGVMDHTDIVLDERYIREARMRVTKNGDVHIAGLTGKAAAKNEHTMSVFSLVVNATDLQVGNIAQEDMDSPMKNMVLVGLSTTKEGRSYLTTSTHSMQGIASGAHGAELKNITFKGEGLRVYHLSPAGKFDHTTWIPMANRGDAVAQILPVPIVFQGDLVLVFNDDLLNLDARKKGGEMNDGSKRGEDGVVYIQLNYAGEMYSRPILKGDDPVRSIFPYHYWELAPGELFMMGRSTSKNFEFHMVKVHLTEGS